MRQFCFIISYLIFVGNHLNAQIGGTTCQGMTPICTDQGLNFIANTGGVDIVNAFPTNNYGCMWTGPNPSWYYIEVDIAGNIDMTLSAPQDIDFVLWGPYSSVANAVSNCGNLGNAPGTDVVIDCGISPAATEFVNVTGAQVGQVYVLVIANFAGIAQNISLTQTGGTGGTDCSILNPCAITQLNANIGSCQSSNNTFNVSGTFSFSNSPSTGSCVVSVTNSSGTYSQSFLPPFNNGQIYNYSINNIPSDGSPLTVTVTFSNETTCTMTITGNSPTSCACAADIGTFSTTVNGTATNNFVLCYGDEINLSSNLDFTAPQPISNSINPTYDPGLSWLIYSCPPSIALTPSSLNTLNDDPCLLGTIADLNFNDINDQSLLNQFPSGTFTNNTIYLVPVTMYSLLDDYYSYVNTGSLPCYETGPVFTVQYLPEITYFVSEDCNAGTVTATVSGGAPSLGMGQFEVIPGSLSPGNASLLNNTAGNGGTFTISGLTNGQIFSFDVIDDQNCAITISDTFVGLSPAAITYSAAGFCINSSNQSPTITGMAGGTFNSTMGIDIDPISGAINFSNSQPGSYVINYISPIGSCQMNATTTVNIYALPTVFAGSDVSICSGQFLTLTATGANTYTWSGGINNGIPFLPLNSETYSVIGTTAQGCSNSDTLNVTVNQSPQINFEVDTTIGCSPLTVNFLNTSGSISNCIWTFSDGSTINDCGLITHTFTAPGCYNITLSGEQGGCSASLTMNNLICVEENPNAGFIVSENYVTELNSVVNFYNTTIGATNFIWNFGDNSALSYLEDTSHDYGLNEIGQYSVTLIASTDFGCSDTAVANIVLEEDLIFYVPNSFTPNEDSYNQNFKPIFTSGFDPLDYSLYVYNRWGELIFESHNTLIGWDGTYGKNTVYYAQDGIYTWKIEFKTTEDDERMTATGHVVLLK